MTKDGKEELGGYGDYGVGGKEGVAGDGKRIKKE